MTTTPPILDQIDVIHTGPGMPAGRFLRRFWTPVALLDEVRPGRAKPVTIMNERFTYYRGESGEPHLVGFYCAHRSTQMSAGWVEGEELRCFYHGWKYDSTGQCTEQPAEAESYAAKIRIAGYPTRAYLGFVYAFLGEGEPPEFPRFPVFERPGRLFPRSFVRHSNYWNGLENACDQIHVNFVHRNSEFTAAGMSREIPKIDAHETEYGILRDVRFSDGASRIAHTIIPTTSLVVIYVPIAGFLQHLSYRIPVDDESHVSFTVNLVDLADDEMERYVAAGKERARKLTELPTYAETIAAVLRGEIHLDDLDRPDIVNLQDDVALAAQPPVGLRPNDRLGQSDIQIIELRKIYARELRALEAGTALKTWTVPSELIATSG
ncbi:MAG TPA: Rieske 2Fe-2S domain-containing protein [Candidatus Binatia bacterium]|nr:Rieske 2Fe-2S domain-containing protein [Candidatus Binatia bacterium]